MATNVTSMHALGYYLERIRTFLEGNKKTISFPSISPQLENALVKIVTDNTDFLHDDQYNEKVKMEAVNLTATMKTYVNTFKLIHEYVEKDGQRILMYRKEPLDTFKIPKPMRKPKEVQACSISPADEVVTTAFKTRCLNNTTKFVKDDSSLIMRYPELSADEAEFVMGMLMQGQQGSTQLMDVGYGFRSIYAPLWESMRLFTSKYHYELKAECCSTRAGGKTVIFEKIPKRVKPPEKKDVEVISTVLNNKTSSETSSSFTSRSSSPVASSPVASVTKQKNIKVVNKVRNASILVRRLRKYIGAQNLTNEFVESSLQLIENFVSKQEEASLIFDRINLQQLFFLDNVNRICNSDPAYMLFTSQSQRYLNNIKYFITNNTKYAVSTSKYAGQKMLRQVVFTKLVVFSKNTATNPVTAPKTVTNEKDVAVIKQTVAAKKPEVKIQTDQTKVANESDVAVIKQAVVKNQEVKIQTDQTKIAKERDVAVIKQTVAAKNPEAKIQPDQTKVANEGDVAVIKQTVAAKNPEAKMQPDQTKVANEGEKLNTEVVAPSLSLKAQKNLELLKIMIDKVTQAKGEIFLQKILEELSDFLSKTDEEICLFYDKATPEEYWFLEKAHKLSTMDAAYPLFSRQCQQLLSSIKASAKNYELDFTASNVPSGDVSSGKSYFHVTILKLPLCGKGSKKKSKRARSLSANSRVKTETARSAKVNSARGTSTQPPALPLAKAKLMEGLAQPVQSEKATRMMQSMGWTGGALGRRGTGITEPIAPSLDLSIRAGFGAPKPEPKPAKVKAKATKPTPPSQSSMDKLIQASTPQANTAQANTAQANTAQANTAPANSVQANSVQANSNQANSVQANSAQANSKQDTSVVLPYGVQSSGLIPTDSLPPEIHPPGCEPDIIKTVMLEADYRLATLKCVLELITTGIDAIQLVLITVKAKRAKVISFVKHVVIMYNNRNSLGLGKPDWKIHEAAVMKELKENPGILFKALVVKEHQAIMIRIKRLLKHKSDNKKPNIYQIPPIQESKVKSDNTEQPSSRECSEEVNTENNITKDVSNTKYDEKSGYSDMPISTEIQQEEATLEDAETAVNQNLQESINHSQTHQEKDPKQTTDQTDVEMKEIQTEVETTIASKDMQITEITNQITKETGESQASENPDLISPNTHKHEVKTLNIKNHEEVLITGKSPKIETIKTQNEREEIREIQNVQDNTTETHNIVSETAESQNMISNLQDISFNTQKSPDNTTHTRQTLKDTYNVHNKTIDSQNQENILKNISFSKTNFQYFTLIHLLEFCKSKHTIKTIHLKEDVPPKMMAYIYVIISVINMRNDFSGSSIEKDMVESIKSSISGYALSADFDMPMSIVLYKIPSAWTNNNSINKNMNVTTAPKVDSRTDNKTTSKKLSNADINARNRTQNITYIDLSVDDTHIVPNSGGTSNVKIVNRNTDAGNDVLIENTKKNIFKPSDNANIVDTTNKNKTNIVAATKNNKTVIGDPTGNDNANDKIVQKLFTHSGTEIVSGLTILNDTKTIISKTIKTSNDNVQADIIQSDDKNITENLKHNDENKNELANYDDDGFKIIPDNSGCLEIDSEADNRLLVSDAGTEIRSISNNLDIDKADNIKHLKSDGLENVLDALKNVMTDDIGNAVKVEISDSYSENQDSSFRKRVSTETINRNQATKKCKLVDFKKLCILHKNYPQIKINSEKAREIQTSILNATDFTNQDLLPVLTCQGIQNDSLVYMCHDENSLSFMEDWIKTAAEYKIEYEFEAKENSDHKMAFKINSYIDESVDRILNRLELYNSGLNTTTWSFIKKEQYSDFIVIYVELDEISFRYICDANFILPAGNDCARFTIVWD